MIKNKRILCVSSGTSAIHLLLLFYKTIGKSNFLVPSFNFPSVACNTTFCNINICDIDKNYTIPIEIIKNSHFYDGFVIPSLFGTLPKNLLKIIDICKIKKKILILDNCSSPLSELNNINICNLGSNCAISFHHTKYFGFGEGGALVCNDKDYDILCSLSNFGFLGNRNYSKYSSNFKMSDVAASFILSHIRRYNIKQHIKIQNKLLGEIKNIENVNVLNYSDGVVYGNFPVLFNKNINSEFFLKLGIECNKYYQPLRLKDKNSMDLYSKIINFPLNASMNDLQVEFIIKQIYSANRG